MITFFLALEKVLQGILVVVILVPVPVTTASRSTGLRERLVLSATAVAGSAYIETVLAM